MTQHMTCADTHVGIELVVLRRENHLPQVLTDTRHLGQVDPVVVETQQLMNHRLVRPLKDSSQTRLLTYRRSHTEVSDLTEGLVSPSS